MKADLYALEEEAGIRKRHAAFNEAHGKSDLRKLYFSVLDKSLRKALMSQWLRSRTQGLGSPKARLADAQNKLATLEARGFSTPWAIPGLLACAAVWIGYSLWSVPGALAGAVAGFFAGNAYVSPWIQGGGRMNRVLIGTSQIGLALAILILTACGGGGGSDTSQHVQQFQLSVNITGIGDGLVSFESGGISCQKTSGTCTAWYDSGAMVQLTASAHSGYVFLGWSGACNGSGTCTIFMSQTTTLRAAFVNVAFISARKPDGTDAPNANGGTLNVWVVNTDGTALKALTNATAVGTDTSGLAWSADGTKLLFASSRSLDGSDALSGASNIWSVNADGSDLKALTRETTLSCYAPQASPDGTRIAFGKGWQIWVMNIDGSDPTPLTPPSGDIDEGPIWSPDSTQIAFTRAQGASPANPFPGRTIWVIGADGTGLAELATESSAAPAWSPDGRRIAFDASPTTGPGAVYAIWIMNANGTNQTPLTNSTLGSSYGPKWSSDGARLTFVSNGINGVYQNIWAINSDGTGLVPITNGMSYSSAEPQWYPETQRIVFSSDRRPDGADVQNPADNIWIINVDTGVASPLTDATSQGANSVAPVWSLTTSP